jgi:tetratricopeptide (TPR) repeat protein
MWADNFEEQLIEIFAVQSRIADQIVLALGLTLVETDKTAPANAPTTNMAAYNFYLRGLEISSHTFNMSDFSESIRMFDSAIALDPDFALAWAQKSISHSTFNFFFTSIDAGYHKKEGLRAAEKSLDLDPTQPSSKIAMGTYYNYIKRDYEKALELYYSAESEVTSNAELSQSIGIVYMRQGKWQDAREKLEEAVRIDPLNVRRYFYLTNCLSMTRDYDDAFTYLDRALVLEPSNADAAYMVALINLLQHGTLEFGARSFDKLSSKAGLTEISTYELASASALGLWRFIIDKIDPKEAIENVRNLGEIRSFINERSPHITHINIGQIYDLTGHHDSALIHYDSSLILIDEIIANGDYQHHALSELGLTYALLGRKEKAIEYGNAAKEFTAVDACHW